MAKTETRYFSIHKPNNYDRFIQVGFENAGIAMGKLTKIGAKNLYLYLVSNKNNYESFELKVANFANWLGTPIFDKNGNRIESLSATYRKQVNEGIAQMIQAGYLVQKFPNVYDFYEGGISEINSSESDNQLQMKQIVSENTNSSESNNLLQDELSVTELKQIVLDETDSNECNNQLQKEQIVTGLPIAFEF